MYKTFTRILIPVDLSINTELAVKKALQLADFPCTLHLVYVQCSGFSPYAKWSEMRKSVRLVNDNGEIGRKLMQWKTSIEETNENVEVCTWNIVDDNIQGAIEAKAIKLKVDLIIIGKHSNHYILPFLNTVTPSLIADSTGIPVLTAKPGSMHSKMQTVLVPILNDTIYNKLSVLTLMSRKFPLHIYLVTFNEPGNNQESFTTPILQMYHWLKKSMRCVVEIAVLPGNHSARGILRYAHNINADFILLNSKSETRAGWMNKHISDLILPDSQIQILTIKSSA